MEGKFIYVLIVGMLRQENSFLLIFVLAEADENHENHCTYLQLPHQASSVFVCFHFGGNCFVFSLESKMDRKKKFQKTYKAEIVPIVSKYSFRPIWDIRIILNFIAKEEDYYCFVENFCFCLM